MDQTRQAIRERLDARHEAFRRCFHEGASYRPDTIDDLTCIGQWEREHAPQDVAALLAALDAAEQEIERLKDNRSAWAQLAAQAEAENARLRDAECLTCGAKPSDHVGGSHA